jgi:hypothetical protein
MSEKALFADAEKQLLEDKIDLYESTINYIEDNISKPDFYVGDLEEVELSRSKYEEELRMLRIQRELAICTGLPAVGL